MSITFEVSQKFMLELNEVLSLNNSDISVTSVVQIFILPLLTALKKVKSSTTSVERKSSSNKPRIKKGKSQIKEGDLV